MRLRLTIIAEPAPVPSLVHMAEPLVLAHRPCLATPTISMSRSGREAMPETLPHSESTPARLAAAAIQAEPVMGMPPAPPGALPPVLLPPVLLPPVLLPPVLLPPVLLPPV